MVNKFEQRLAGWKRSLFQKEEDSHLLKSILDKLLMYYMSILTIPVSVANKLEAIQSKFLWRDVEDRKNIIW